MKFLRSTTGRRVSELLALDVAQYHTRGFVNVLRKGGHVQRFIPIQRQHREVLDEWLGKRGDAPGPVFLTRSGKRLDRTQAFLILKRIARQANAHLPPDQHLDVSPHVLRHTLLRKVANEKSRICQQIFGMGGNLRWANTSKIFLQQIKLGHYPDLTVRVLTTYSEP
jgi:site-specific recombinase XerD